MAESPLNGEIREYFESDSNSLKDQGKLLEQRKEARGIESDLAATSVTSWIPRVALADLAG